MFCKLTQQQRPSAPADIDQLAVNEEGTGRLRSSDVELSSNGIKGLLEHAAELDRDGADIDGKAVDLLGRGAAAEAAPVVHDDGMQASMGKPRGGAKPARTGTYDDRICPNNRHPTSQRVPRAVDPGWCLSIIPISIL